MSISSAHCLRSCEDETEGKGWHRLLYQSTMVVEEREDAPEGPLAAAS